jgi:hypothetical protein
MPAIHAGGVEEDSMSITLNDNPTGTIESLILTIRGCRVILDRDLAQLYGVTTKKLNQQVRRNRKKFPSDFLFEIQPHEKDELVTNCDHLRTLKYSKSLPLAFTEHGAIMAASVLNSKAAVEMSIFVVRAFVRLKEILVVYRDLEERVARLEGSSKEQKEAVETVIQLLEHLHGGDQRSTPRIGFRTPPEGNDEP